MSWVPTYWVDYDRDQLPALSPSERINWFEGRVKLVVLNPIDRLLHQTEEVSRIEGTSALLLIGVGMCSAIEATGKFLNGGRGGNADRFHAFLNKYMSADYRSRSIHANTFGKVLWAHFRNGIAHGFAVCHGGFEGHVGDPYFTVKPVAGRDSLYVNPSALLGDFQQGFDRYLVDLRAAPAGSELLTNFLNVFKDVFILGI